MVFIHCTFLYNPGNNDHQALENLFFNSRMKDEEGDTIISGTDEKRVSQHF